ncbi:DUF6444 domain-containing protein, partial [Oligoflexia bacterium]|nr:DUF6444 domain-containing protein [Oligoflexia bacterium]
MAEQLDIERAIKDIKDPNALEVIGYLLKRIQILEEKIAVLEKDSSTSSKPPSSDITSPPNKRRQKGKRKRGSQQGHKRSMR